jgi:hypothetical protein
MFWRTWRIKDECMDRKLSPSDGDEDQLMDGSMDDLETRWWRDWRRTFETVP